MRLERVKARWESLGILDKDESHIYVRTYIIVGELSRVRGLFDDIYSCLQSDNNTSKGEPGR